MAIWSDMGHAMRRRASVSSNHHESAGANMSRNIPTPEEVLASVTSATSARRYVGQDTAFNNVSGAPQRGTLVPKKNMQAGDPTGYGIGNQARQAVAVNASNSERMGARYSIGANLPGVHSIEAASTMANAKIVPTVQGRQNPNFGMGVEGPY